MSPNVEVQCNAVGCITNLATHEENKAKIARSGALGPLTRLAKSRDMRVQRNATGALLNMTHSGRFRVPRCVPVLMEYRREPTTASQRWSHSCACTTSFLTRC
jgi:vacuolar protein 8